MVKKYIREVTVTIQKKLNEAIKIIKNLIDDEECRYDHHGYCQTHTCGMPCEVAEARKFIESVEKN